MPEIVKMLFFKMLRKQQPRIDVSRVKSIRERPQPKKMRDAFQKSGNWSDGIPKLVTKGAQLSV